MRDPATGEVLAEVCDSLGTATNNVAEYSGLVAGLRAAAELAPGADVEVRMDSKLVVEQMSGRWQIKDPNLRTLARSAAGRGGGSAGSPTPGCRGPATPTPTGSRTRPWMRRRPARPGQRGRGRRSVTAQRRMTGAGRRHRRAVAARGWGPARGQPTTTLLLRHGQTPLSAERRFAGRGDIPLTEDGRRQAAAAAGAWPRAAAST